MGALCCGMSKPSNTNTKDSRAQQSQTQTLPQPQIIQLPLPKNTKKSKAPPQARAVRAPTMTRRQAEARFRPELHPSYSGSGPFVSSCSSWTASFGVHNSRSPPPEQTRPQMREGRTPKGVTTNW